MWALDGRTPIAHLSPRPLFLIHGRNDVMIPPANMTILYDSAMMPKEQWLGPGPHSNILTTSFDDYQQRVITFFNHCRVAPILTSHHRSPS